jgi:uncharacterized delta-60 repeat protein
LFATFLMGHLTQSFGKVGVNIVGSDSSNDAVQQQDSKIVLSGCSSCDAGADFAFARFNPDGSLDTSFGNGGKVTTDMAGGYDQATTLPLQTDGKLIGVGRAGNDRGLARYNASGAPVGPLVYPVSTNTRSTSGNTNVVATVGTTGISAGDTATVSVATGTFAGAVGCSDSKGNTYSVSVDRNSGQGRIFVCTAHLTNALTTGDTITGMYPVFSGISVVSVNAISAFASNGTVTATSSANGNSATPNSGNIAVAGPTVLLGVIGHNSTPTLTPGSGYTLVGQVSGGTGSSKRTLSPEFQVVSNPGSYNANATISNGGQFWQAAVVGYSGN